MTVTFFRDDRGGYIAQRQGLVDGRPAMVQHYIPNITASDIAALQTSSSPIQNIIPHVSAEDREFLVSGTTPRRWDELFAGVNDV